MSNYLEANEDKAPGSYELPRLERLDLEHKRRRRLMEMGYRSCDYDREMVHPRCRVCLMCRKHCTCAAFDVKDGA